MRRIAGSGNVSGRGGALFVNLGSKVVSGPIRHVKLQRPVLHSPTRQFVSCPVRFGARSESPTQRPVNLCVVIMLES